MISSRISILIQGLICSIILFSCSQQQLKYEPARIPQSDKTGVDVLMCPVDGERAFVRIYDKIAAARDYVYVTIYSWSDSGLDQAITKALGNKAKVRVILHPDLKTSKKIVEVVPKLEGLGAEFKFAAINMHEKFVLVDDKILINTSANFSTGAKNKYSENVVFHLNEENVDKKEDIAALVSAFKNEFAILWNTGKDIQTNSEKNSSKISEMNSVHYPEIDRDIALFSSSMNWEYKENSPSSAGYRIGKYYSLGKKNYKNTDKQLWTVRDVILKSISEAKKSIYLSLNHFNIKEISDSLIEALGRGIDVRLTVDNQEYKSRPNNVEMTPQFVADWKKLKGKVSPPVRVKYYSHEPSPAFWLLNHHKFILIDYEVENETVLLSGSYNLSETAEQNQFDNLIRYQSETYRDLYKNFYKEFVQQWSWNRSQEVPSRSVLEKFTKIVNGNSIIIHNDEAVSLSWEEVQQLRSEVSKMAPEIFKGLSKNRDCRFYDFAKKSYWGGNCVK